MTGRRLRPVLWLGVGALACLSCARSELRVVRPEAGPASTVAPLSGTPAVRDPDAAEDFLEHAVRRPLAHALNPPRTLRGWFGEPVEAYNPTAQDDVVDSGWFEHRNGRRRMTPAEIARGPDGGTGPDTSGAWIVMGAKIEGITPGFRIRDAAGVEYLIKFDPPGHPELMTAAEAISQRLFHAAGYNTPATYVTVFDPGRVRASDSLSFRDERGRDVRVSDRDLQEMLRGFPRRADGRLRAIASRILTGLNIGPFRYEGIRKDDPADTIPHEHRRELRGLYVMAAWLNHLDTKQLNTLDVVVEENGQRFVKHYLIDFGSTLWSSSVYANGPRDGVEYVFDLGKIGARLLTGGVYTARWERYDHATPQAALGFYSPDLFDPGGWRSNYPNPAFQRATVRDGYWGANLVRSFDEAGIRAAVAAGQLSDPEAAELLVQAILARRRLTVRYWFLRVTPLEELAITAASGSGPDAADGLEAVELSFRDLAVTEGVVPAAGRRYRMRFEFPVAGLTVDEVVEPRIDPEGHGRLELPVAAHADGGGAAGDAFRERLRGLSIDRRLARLELKAIPGPDQPDPRSVRIYLLPDRERGYRIVGRAY